MKITKLYKSCFALAVASIGAITFADDVLAAYRNINRGSVLSALQKRSDTYVPAAEPKIIQKRSSVEKSPVYADTEYKTTSSGGWFNFNSGPIFDTGSCSTNNKSGPLIDTGPCSSNNKKGPIFDTGPCKTCKVPEKVIEKPVPRIANYTINYNNFVYQAVARDCCSMAPLYLEHVDFKLSDMDVSSSSREKLGNYRFRIFGCRRYDKEAILNHGRIMEKDMNFNKVFEEVTGDCYNLVKMPQDLCLQDTPSPMPEYILTAEITDFFMNVCDGYNWKEATKTEKRTGSAEITVTWRLTNLTKTKVLWEGTTTGYSDVVDGESNGEIALVEKAFADATSNLRNKPGFEDVLAVRLTAEELSAERQALIDEEIALNPAKCQFKKEQEVAKQCQISREEVDIMQCPAVVEQVIIIEECEGCNKCPEVAPCPEKEPCPEAAPCPKCEACEPVVSVPEIVEDSGVIIAHSATVPAEIIESAGVVSEKVIFSNCVDQNGGVISGGDCQVVDDTWIDMQNGDKVFDSLCIVDRPPYDVLSPGNLYKVRASVVEITNALGKKGAGLIISENFVLTSADLVDKATNNYKLKTINGTELTGRAVRVNLSKNTALIMLDEVTKYTPLSLNLDLPKVGQGGFMTLGVLDVEDFEDGENYLDTDGKVTGYRYSEDKGSEIMIDTYVQNVTIGGVLIDANGTINGIAHTGKKTDNGTDLYLPTETALRSLGLSICEKLYEKKSPWQQTVYKPVTELILKSAPKAPEAMVKEERK